MMARRSWQRQVLSRRSTLRGVLAGGGGLAAMTLLACRGGDDSSSGSTATGVPEAVDGTAGKPGGRLVIQNAGHAGTWVVSTGVPAFPVSRVAGLTHSGLIAFDFGRPPSDGFRVGVEPDLATALPEQSDELTFVYKLRDAQFHNGQPVTAEDVKYSFDKLAFHERSSRRSQWFWYERAEVVDPQTVVVRAKVPYVDALLSQAQHADAFIVSRAFDETPEATQKLMGSGPFIWDSDTPPISTTFKRNPNYYLQSHPYFDEVTVLGRADQTKQVADFGARQTQYTYWFPEEPRDQIKRLRPDAKEWAHQFTSHSANPRVDVPPFNDKRVRQAFSMSVDRKAIREAVSKGDGEDDAILSPWADPNGVLGYRKPADLGPAAKYWKYDPQEAKQLLEAAGVSLPIRTTAYHFDATVLGQALPDTATLAAANWRRLGFADLRQDARQPAEYTPIVQGNFTEGMYIGPGLQGFFQAQFIKNRFWSPPEGVSPPTPNSTYVNNPRLSALLDKQVGQLDVEERKKTLREVADIVSEEMYTIPFSTYMLTYFTDPNLRNAVASHWSYNGSMHYVKYWWFG
jgi:ABC-type transport system substrate-binding protein